ncbi:hypothetical protein E1287_18845 [Actinomadura sp. KC06]|uniref:hypothetical protein n=1 Tax=Actinomadura sp. KC06 TaxID=2530369 RepID=UPI001042BCC8|nr:hypothetical protein [Actinomadura sp. KC06]TDD33634.1 hypothetical protein E1287_18845 [Actinomadura sp. KC06]
MAGGGGLTTALHESDFGLTDVDPDYVVLDEALRRLVAGLGLSGPILRLVVNPLMAVGARDRGARRRGGLAGGGGLTTALHESDFGLTDVDPDYVVLGEALRGLVAGLGLSGPSGGWV